MRVGSRPGKERDMSTFDVAQICLNGHVANSSAVDYPQYNQDFCDKCGKETITKCGGCGADIRGLVRDSLAVSGYVAPKFCHTCGMLFPWTQAKIEAAHELADEIDSLSDDEKDLLKKSIDELVSDSPKANVASLRFKKMMAKAGAEIAGVFKGILVSVVTASVKEHLGY